MKKSKKTLYVLTPIAISLSSIIAVSCIVPNNSNGKKEKDPNDKENGTDKTDTGKDPNKKDNSQADQSTNPSPKLDDNKNSNNNKNANTNIDSDKEKNDNKMPQNPNTDKKEDNSSLSPNSDYGKQDDGSKKHDMNNGQGKDKEEMDSNPKPNVDKKDENHNLNPAPNDEKNNDGNQKPDVNSGDEGGQNKDQDKNPDVNDKKEDPNSNMNKKDENSNSNKQDNNPPLEPIELDDNQKNKVIEVFDIDKKMPVSLNLDKLIKKIGKDIEIKDVKILSFSDYAGTITLSISGIYNNRRFSFVNYQIKGFGNYQSIENSNILSAAINKESFIRELKEFKDLHSFNRSAELLKFINVTANKVSIGDLLRKNLIEVESINLNKDNQLTFSLYYIQKYKNENEEEIKIEKKIKISGTRIPVRNEQITNHDILNYIIDNIVEIKSNNKTENEKDKNKTFASFYENKTKLVKNFILNRFFKFDENNGSQYFKNKKGKLFIEIENVRANDVDGILYVSYRVTHDGDGSMESSKTRNIEIKNFPKIKEYNSLKSEFLLIRNVFNDENYTLLSKLYDKFKDENNLTDMEITDELSLQTFLGFKNDWTVIRNIDNSNTAKYQINATRSYWEFQFKGHKLSDIINDNEGILIDPESKNEVISFNNIQVKPIKIYDIEIDRTENRLAAKLKYEITFSVHYANNTLSNNTYNISVIKENSISWKLKK
ncbi:hypothetical protein [Mycoplasma phocoeninasale]|uniref:hypothetical protein n=1 Tax=Mycoplasma phocoeninasale TaxID=2726117 RepID=UPI0019676061|nr:hypothetical protein [Mycoplasma phocoeninasale]MBN0970762.1 hypothetical protein [Mycoplasma phocoeninasale]